MRMWFMWMIHVDVMHVDVGYMRVILYTIMYRILYTILYTNEQY